MKTRLFFILAAFLAFLSASLYAQNIDPLGFITRSFSASQFVAGDIPQADLAKIVNAGVLAPSAMNRQPWRFTVVRNKELASKIIARMPDGNVVIVISVQGNAEKKPDLYLDCALAAENIYLAAQALGYGSRIYTGPVRSIKDDLKESLGIRTKDSVIALVRVGRLRSDVDAVSSASKRKSADTMVFYK